MSPRTLTLAAASGCMIAAMLPAALHAQDRANGTFEPAARQRIEVVATAAPACNIAPGSVAGSDNASFQSSGTSGGTVAITRFADPQTARANPASVQVEIPVVCNSAHAVSLRSANGGMLRSGGAPGTVAGFIQFLPYTVALDWVGQTLTGTSDLSEPLLLGVPNAGQGLLRVDIAIAGSDAPMVAGAYADTLQIEITAAN
ncbi:MAG: hypothetical protein RSE14_01175 [Erythrobacter sp.]|jgi:hypothetical protein|uniref:hypothetical protein n=1 Tax=Erythrobacter sp. TaxID=1042 RepID=UPI002B45D187|nr:hypothetical protein [Erythrobacter sp.]WRH70734.1 MAG: hypothetical protein RSE14_01175 [Erythrobacter sp.]